MNRVVNYKKNVPNISFVTSTPFDRFRIRMRLRLLGITGFSTVFFKNTFFQRFNDYFKPSLIEIQMIYFALFKKDIKTGNKIIRSLDKISPIYYELIEKAGNLYEPYIFDHVIEGYKNFPNVPKPLSELRESLTDLFRLLFILKPYENSILNSFEKSIDISIAFNEGKKDKSINKRELKNSLFIVFNKLYPSLHALFCHYQGSLFSESDKMIEEILSITKTEKPGNRRRMDDSTNSRVEKEPEEEQMSDTEKEADTLSVSDSVKEGLKLMYRLENKTLRELYEKKGEFEILEDTDKVLLAYMLFIEFEKEYSFILTTNKIKYNIDFSSDIKIDYMSKMQDLFNQLNKSQIAFKAYYDTCIENKKIIKQKPLSNDQYIAYSKRLDEIEKKRKLAGSKCRMAIKSFMDNVTNELSVLIEDMNGKQKYISNPQDILEFTHEIEGSKKLKDKKIYEAVETVYNYASALSYRTGPEGDLSGNLEFGENEKQIEVINESSSENRVIEEIEEIEENKEKRKEEIKTEESLFDELDDIIYIIFNIFYFEQSVFKYSFSFCV